ncbi:hypothetical protein A1351_22710 [Methylosinus sp. R-45379]|nr:hypothetical protein A1351_22710 [Methylosinus sp. R-45379]
MHFIDEGPRDGRPVVSFMATLLGAFSTATSFRRSFGPGTGSLSPIISALGARTSQTSRARIKSSVMLNGSTPFWSRWNFETRRLPFKIGEDRSVRIGRLGILSACKL